MKFYKIHLVLIATLFLCGGCCTEMYCPDRLEVSYTLDSGAAFPKGEYTLYWESDGQTGVLSEVVQNDEEGAVVFHIPLSSSDDSYSLSTKNTEFTLELIYAEGVVIEIDTYVVEWESRVCNHCSGVQGDDMV